MTGNAPEKPAKKRRGPGKPWKPGQSGNPAGKPKGTRHKVTMAVEALLDGEAKKLTRKAVELALAGDTVALRLCLERLAPPRKDRPIAIELPDNAETIQDAAAMVGAILQAAARGEITPSEAAAMAGIAETYRRTLESADLESRIAALEAQKGTDR